MTFTCPTCSKTVKIKQEDEEHYLFQHYKPSELYCEPCGYWCGQKTMYQGARCHWNGQKHLKKAGLTTEKPAYNVLVKRMRDEGQSPWTTNSNFARNVATSVSTITPRKSYDCPKCPGVKITSRGARRRHDRYFHEGKVVNCLIEGCNEPSRTTAEMLTHILVHHDKPDVLFCRCCLFWCDSRKSYDPNEHWTSPTHNRNLKVARMRDASFVEIERPPLCTLLSQLADKYLSEEEAKNFKQRQQSPAPQNVPDYLVKTIPTVLMMTEGSPPPVQLPTFGLIPDLRFSHTAKVLEGPKGTFICTSKKCGGASHPYVSGVFNEGESFIDIAGYRLNIESYYDDDTRRLIYLIRCKEHVLMRCVGKKIGKFKKRIDQYIAEIDVLIEDRVKKEREIEIIEGKWRQLTESEFRELLFGHNEQTGKRCFKYSLVSAHFAWYDCELHNINFSVIKCFEYVDKYYDEVKKEMAQGEKFFQFMLDCCHNSTMGCNIKAEYTTGANPKELSSFMGLVKLNMANASQFKKEQAKNYYKDLHPGLKEWNLKEIEWVKEEEDDEDEDEEDDEDGEEEENDEPSSSKKSKIDSDS